MPQLGITDPLSDATVVTLAAFNRILARRSLGEWCLAGRPGWTHRIITTNNVTYCMGGNLNWPGAIEIGQALTTYPREI